MLCADENLPTLIFLLSQRQRGHQLMAIQEGIPALRPFSQRLPAFLEREEHRAKDQEDSDASGKYLS